MNDEEILTKMRGSLTGVKDSLTDVHMDWPADAIRARARGRRLRRSLPGAGAAATALGVGLALTLSSGSPAPTVSSKAVHVNLAAWSVNTRADGIVYVTIHEMGNLKRLGATLAAAGVPTVIFLGADCYQLNDLALAPVNRKVLVSMRALPNEMEFGINARALPPGYELDISEQTMSGPGGFGVIQDDAKLSCQVLPVYDGPPPPPKVKPAPYPALHYLVYSPPVAG
jgi:hypothetical protein